MATLNCSRRWEMSFIQTAWRVPGVSGITSRRPVKLPGSLPPEQASPTSNSNRPGIANNRVLVNIKYLAGTENTRMTKGVSWAVIPRWNQSALRVGEGISGHQV